MKKKQITLIITAVLTVALAFSAVIVGVIKTSKTDVKSASASNEKNESVDSRKDTSKDSKKEKDKDNNKDKNKETSSKEKFFEADDKDFKVLYDDNDSSRTLIGALSDVGEDFDCEVDKANDFLNKVFFYGPSLPFSSVYGYYYGEPEPPKKDDPLKKFKAFPEDFDMATDENYHNYFYQYEADKLEWIMQNIFNVKPTRENGFNGDERNYYYDGYYYAASYYGIGIDDGYQLECTSKTRLKDGKYELEFTRLYYNFAHLNERVVGTVKITAGLKMIDGKKQWSIYKIKLSKNIDNVPSKYHFYDKEVLPPKFVSLEKQIESHYMKLWQPDGSYMCTEYEEHDDRYTFILRYQISDKLADEIISNGGTVYPNTYVSKISVDKATGKVSDEYGNAPSWMPKYPCNVVDDDEFFVLKY